jgi:hypothetical protein
MSKQIPWRKLALWTAIDAILIVTAGSAMAAPAASAATASMHVPALLMLGIGMVTAGRFGRS